MSAKKTATNNSSFIRLDYSRLICIFVVKFLCMKYIEYLSFRFTVELIRLCPFFMLYAFSDFISFILRIIIRYRNDVIYNNLRNSFPDKAENEIRNLYKSFYKHLSDITLESLKGMTVSEKNIKKRYIIKNTSISDEYFSKGHSVLCLTSHYGNWEYGILGTNNSIKHQAIALYLPLSNKYSEKYGLKRRKRFGMQMVAVQETKSIFEKKTERPVAVIMAADQSPSNQEKAIWTKFLNQDTACLHGPEAYAKKVGLPVLYLSIKKTKRGYYEQHIEKLIENPQDMKPNEITKIYMNRLEADILEKPEYYLWSHKRWKHKKQNNYD